MLNITITGKTYDHRETLKAFGAKFNGNDKSWLITGADETTVASIRALPGVAVDVYGEPLPGPVAPKPVREGNTMFIGSDRTHFNTFAVKNPRTFAGFRSLDEMCDYIAAIPATIRADRTNGRNQGWAGGGANWAGSFDMTEALKLARNGWANGVAKAQEAMEILTADHVERRTRKMSVAGGRANVGRMLSGNPLHMVNRTRQPSQKVIRLYVQFWMAVTISADDAIIRAAAIAAMADMLENAGYSCEIVAVGTNQAHTDKSNACHIAVTLKHAGEPLNINDIVFALGHPSMLRRMGFAIAAVNPDLHKFWSNMGNQQRAFDETEPGSFYIGKIEHDAKVTGRTFAERVRSMFPLIVPENFPVTLAE